MKKLLIFVFGLFLGAVITGLYVSQGLESFLEGQTKRELAARIDWVLIYKKQLESIEIDKLTEVLNSSIKHDAELILAMDNREGGTQDIYIKSVLGRVSEAGIELSPESIETIARELNRPEP